MENVTGWGSSEIASGSEQLAAIAQARAAAADRLTTPWWYHPTLGLLCAAYVPAVSFGAAAWRAVAVVLFVCAGAALVQAYRRQTGVWVSGFHRGRSRRWAIATSLLLGLTVAGGLATAQLTDRGWVVWLLSAVAFVGVNAFGRAYDAALRADLRARP
jgi:hypothetical protein